MNKITWDVLLPLIIQYGFPAVMRMWQLAQSKTVATAEQWSDLTKLSEKTYADYAAEHGVPLPPPA